MFDSIDIMDGHDPRVSLSRDNPLSPRAIDPSSQNAREPAGGDIPPFSTSLPAFSHSFHEAPNTDGEQPYHG